MLQGHGRVLKGRMQISHGQMSGIACLREETEVRELKSFDHRRFLIKNSGVGLSLIGGVDKHEGKKDNVEYKINQK